MDLCSLLSFGVLPGLLPLIRPHFDLIDSDYPRIILEIDYEPSTVRRSRLADHFTPRCHFFLFLINSCVLFILFGRFLITESLPVGSGEEYLFLGSGIRTLGS